MRDIVTATALVLALGAALIVALAGHRHTPSQSPSFVDGGLLLARCQDENSADQGCCNGFITGVVLPVDGGYLAA